MSIDFAKLRGRSLDELRIRSVQWLRSRGERALLQLPAIAGRAVHPPLPQSWLATRPTINHLQRAEDPIAIARSLASTNPGLIFALRRQADALEQGRCPVLGLDALEIGNPPSWHRDATSGRIAPRKHWSRIDHLDVDAVGDHKVLWEINRHQYLLAPAVCWLVDGEPRRFQLIQAHLRSWLDENPPNLGINWASSLEIAYRGIAWCWLLWLLRAAPWDSTLLARMAATMQAQGLHVERYLSTYFSPNTHLTGEALGLFYLGTVLPESPHASRWRTTGARILESWIDRQVLPDGVYFEQSTQYQRYTAEIYLHYVVLSRSTHWPVAASVIASLNRQFDVLRSLADGSGCMPLIGDDDGGLLLPLDHRPPDDVAGLLLAGASALKRPDLVIPERVESAMAEWLCGPDDASAVMAATRTVPDWTDMHFRSGGVVVMRTGWAAADAVAVVDAGPHGAMNCGHAHADALSMTLTLGQTPLFIDRGTASYVGPDRDRFRGTASHNTLEIDAESSVTPRGPFQWGQVPPRPTATLCDSRSVAMLESRAYGHADTGRPSVHRRVVIRGPGGAWAVLDEGHRVAAAGGMLRWHLAPRLEALQRSESLVEIIEPGGTTVAWLVFVGATRCEMLTSEVSPRLRRTEPACVIELDVGPRLRALSVIVPAATSIGAPSVEHNGENDGFIIAWRDWGGYHRVAWTHDPTRELTLAGWRAQLSLGWWTDSSAGAAGTVSSPDHVIALDASRLCSPENVNLIAGHTAGEGMTGAYQRTLGSWIPVSMDAPHRGVE